MLRSKAHSKQEVCPGSRLMGVFAMKYEFLIDTYETERIKVISALPSTSRVRCTRRSVFRDEFGAFSDIRLLFVRYL